MHILLVGQVDSVTQTVFQMLEEVDEWFVKVITSHKNDDGHAGPSSPKYPAYDVIVANCLGFSDSPNKLIRQITAQFPNTPLLALHSYSQKLLIQPLFEAGATGYLQVGIGEDKLLQAINKVITGKQCILTENTY